MLKTAPRCANRTVSRYLEDLAVTTTGSTTPAGAAAGDEAPNELHSARLALCQATRQVIENGFVILGVTAPERISSRIPPVPGTPGDPPR